MVPVDPLDERRHRPAGGVCWSETYDLRFFAGDASLGGYVSVTMFPALGFSWFWASLAGPGRRLVTVLEQQAPIPRSGTLELRTSGLWCELQCEVPLEHFTVGLEAFGLALDRPSDALGEARGEPMPLGFDLEWANERRDVTRSYENGYEAPGRVVGEILVGDERIDFDGWGARGHRWGGSGSWAEDRCRLAGRLDDGSAVLVDVDVPPFDGVPASLEFAAPVADLVGHAVAWAPVAAVAPGGQGVHFLRGLVRLAGGGGSGAGWLDCVRRAPGERAGGGLQHAG